MATGGGRPVVTHQTFGDILRTGRPHGTRIDVPITGLEGQKPVLSAIHPPQPVEDPTRFHVDEGSAVRDDPCLYLQDAAGYMLDREQAAVRYIEGSAGQSIRGQPVALHSADPVAGHCLPVGLLNNL